MFNVSMFPICSEYMRLYTCLTSPIRIICPCERGISQSKHCINHISYISMMILRVKLILSRQKYQRINLISQNTKYMTIVRLGAKICLEILS